MPSLTFSYNAKFDILIKCQVWHSQLSILKKTHFDVNCWGTDRHQSHWSMKTRSRSPDHSACSKIISRITRLAFRRQNTSPMHFIVIWPWRPWKLDQDPKNSNHLFKSSNWCICASLVKIWPLIQKIECRQGFFRSYTYDNGDLEN